TAARRGDSDHRPHLVRSAAGSDRSRPVSDRYRDACGLSEGRCLGRLLTSVLGSVGAEFFGSSKSSAVIRRTYYWLSSLRRARLPAPIQARPRLHAPSLRCARGLPRVAQTPMLSPPPLHAGARVEATAPSGMRQEFRVGALDSLPARPVAECAVSSLDQDHENAQHFE